jgi:formylglycine-generating enzyme required for sulfatase activity
VVRGSDDRGVTAPAPPASACFEKAAARRSPTAESCHKLGVLNKSISTEKHLMLGRMAKRTQHKQVEQPKAPPKRPDFSNKVFVALVLSLIVLGTGWALHSRRRTTPTEAMQRAPEAGVTFGPTIPNTKPAPGPPPQGMAWIPGGEFSMGAQDPPDMDEVGMKATVDSRPIHPGLRRWLLYG